MPRACSRPRRGDRDRARGTVRRSRFRSGLNVQVRRGEPSQGDAGRATEITGRIVNQFFWQGERDALGPAAGVGREKGRVA